MAEGNPRGMGRCRLGVVVALRAAARVDSWIGDALAKGAERLAGGDAEGVLVPATVIDRAPPAMRLFREESFGPAVVRAADKEWLLSREWTGGTR